MEIKNALQMIVPGRDSHFLLNDCRCGSDQVVYLQMLVGDKPYWVVRCMECGAQTIYFSVRHDAQVEWNRRIAK